MKKLFALLLSVFKHHQSSSLRDDLAAIRGERESLRLRAARKVQEAAAAEKGLNLAMHTIARELGELSEARQLLELEASR